MCEGIGTFFLTWVLMDLDMATIFYCWDFGLWDIERGSINFVYSAKKARGTGATLTCGARERGRKVFLFPSTFGWLAAVVVIKGKESTPVSTIFSALLSLMEIRRVEKVKEKLKASLGNLVKDKIWKILELRYVVAFR